MKKVSNARPIITLVTISVLLVSVFSVLTPRVSADPITVLTTSGPTTAPPSFCAFFGPCTPNIADELTAIGGFSVTVVTPAAFALMTPSQLQGFDVIALETKDPLVTGLGPTWSSVVGVTSGNRVFLTEHDPMFHSFWERNTGPSVFGVSINGARLFLKNSVTWGGSGSGKPGLVVFGLAFGFQPGSYGPGSFDSLPPAWGISEGDVSGGCCFTVGLSIVPAFTGHPIYTGVTDTPNTPSNPVPNSISTFASAGFMFGFARESYHRVFTGFNSAIFTMTDTSVSPSPFPGSAVSLLREEVRLIVSKFFTDTSLNPLPLDQKGNPKVDVVLAGGVVRSTNPGEIMAWVNVTNTDGSLQSLKLNETLPMDWVVAPPWMPARGAVHVFFANTTSLATNPEITQPSTITVSTGNPEKVHLAIPSFNATGIGHPLLKNQSILLEVKLDYGLDGASPSASSFPRNYTDTATAKGWTMPSFTGTAVGPSTGMGLFTAYAKVVGDVDGDGSVDITDLVLVWQHQFTANGQFDVNGDGAVDINDLVITWQFQFT